MLELIKYFRVLFLSTKLSRERLKDFTEAHILSLTAHNPGGIFTTILTAITAAYNSYFGDLSSELVNKAVQEGKTIAMNDSRTALEKQLSDNEKLVAYTYRNNMAKYEEFYPLGLTEYQNADLGTFDTITQRYKTVLSNNSADFTPGFVTDYNDLQDTFKDNRQAQQTAMSNVATERSDLATTRPALGLQLTTNLLTIALKYVGDESKCEVYFNQAILNEAFKVADRKVESEINPGDTQNIFDNVSKADLKLNAVNKGEGVLYIGFKEAENEPATDADYGIKVGENITIQAAEWGWTTKKKYLNITNLDGMSGSYMVQKL